MLLHAKQLNHGQSEIYIDSNGVESAHRILATNELRNVTRALCTPDAFEAFYEALSVKVGNPATLNAPNMEKIAEELRLTR